jgi:hypothetical protein
MCAASIDMMRESTANVYLADILDNLIPLRDASHAEVVRYHVDIPMRYAECFAELADGRRVAFRDKRRFIGWIGHRPCESLLFRSDGLHIAVEIAQGEHGPIRDVAVKTAKSMSGGRVQAVANRVRKFIGIDGSQVLMPVT